MSTAKQRIYEQFARISKALAAPGRLELVDLLTQGGLSVANASQHLRVLAGARLVEARRDAQRVLYRIADDSVDPRVRYARPRRSSFRWSGARQVARLVPWIHRGCSTGVAPVC